MSDYESLAEQTCHQFLTAVQLKALCGFRGFSPPAADKRTLAAFVAARLPETAGVQDAMKSLDETGLVLLHRLAMSASAVPFRDLRESVNALKGGRLRDDRTVFDFVMDNLATRGCVLVEDDSRPGRSSQGRWTRLSFRLVHQHRVLVPPFPVETLGLGKDAAPADTLAFCRKAIVLAVGRHLQPPDFRPRTTLERLTAQVKVADGWLTAGGSAGLDVPGLVGWARRAWLDAWPAPKRYFSEQSFRQCLAAALHVLSNLPPGHGVDARALAGATAKLGLALTAEELAPFLAEGHGCGFLARGGSPAVPVYAASEATPVAAPLAFEPVAAGVRIDLDHSGLAPIFELATVSRADAQLRQLVLSPDVARLGRAVRLLDGSPVLAAVLEKSEAYAAAARHVRARHGKLVLHEELLVIRADDLGFRTLVAAKLGQAVRALGGPYLAVPAGLSAEVEKLAQKEGYSPRRLS